MLRVEFKAVEVGDDVDIVAINNILQCDTHKRTDLMMCAMVGWLNNDKTRDYVQIEQMLRLKKCNTYLIAKPYNNSKKNMRLTMPNDNTLDKTHELIITFDHNEILKYHDSYEQNFILLRYAGCFAYRNNPNDNKNVDEHKEIEESKKDIKFDGNNFEYNLTQNTIYLTLIQMNNKETVEYISECLEKKFNNKPLRTIVGTIENKNKINVDVYSFTIDNKIISECAWTLNDNDNNNNNNNNNDVDLIDLRRVKMEENEK